jgi:hypothetical protein
MASRVMLIHFALHWPQASSTDLWPFAVDQAIYIWNHLPDSDTKLSPIELITQTSFTVIIIFRTYMCLAVRSMYSILPYKMQRNCPSGIAKVDGQFILVTVGDTPTMSVWFSTLKQGISLLSIILFSMIPSLLSIQMELSMPTSGTH